MHQLSYLLLSLLSLTAVFAKQPNIVFVFSDDHATQAISAYGSRLADVAPTPHLDRLASEGILFDRCMVTNSICGPSRAVIQTGKHSHLNGFLNNQSSFDGTQQTFPKLLQQHGYQTAIVGKWHLKSEPQGYDYWDVLPGQGHYYNPDFISTNGKYRVTGYVSEIITEKAIQWLEEQRNTDRPFMLMVQHKAPHREWAPAPKYLTAFDNVTIPEPETLFDDYKGRGTAARKQDMSIAKTMSWGKDLKVRELARKGSQLEKRVFERMTPEQVAQWEAAYNPKNKALLEANLEGDDLIRWKYQRYLKDYLRTIKSVDESVGQLRAHLEKLGLAEETVFIYSSDQGFYLGEHGWFDKRFMYDESFRTPLIVSWPGVYPAGKRIADLVSNLDFAQTFLEITGAPQPNDMQGRSLVPILKGKTPKDWRKSLYYHYYEGPPAVHKVQRHEGAYDGRYKLMNFYDIGEWELYDTKTDPNEMQNQYHNPEYARVVARMKQELAHLRENYKVPPLKPSKQIKVKKNKKLNW
ncbi:MAG: sulfatase [Verrucomicrobiota bacterium]